jgi:hypothetical protein
MNNFGKILLTVSGAICFVVFWCLFMHIHLLFGSFVAFEPHFMLNLNGFEMFFELCNVETCRVPPPYRPCVIGLEETGMMTVRPWWRLLVGGEAWWWCSFAAEFFCGLGSGEILVGLSEPNTVPLSRGTIPSWRALWEASVYFTPSRGGPGSSAVSTVFSFLKVLLGSRCFGVL